MSDSSQGIRDVYRQHHTKGNRLGRTVAEGLRGSFLRERIGTGKKVLDIGCRDGVLTKTYAEGNEVLGLDIDDVALAALEEETDVTTRQTDLNGDWGVESNAYDVVVAGEVIEHLYFPEKVVEKIAVALKPGGMLLGSVPNAFSLQNRVRLLRARKRSTPLSDPTHINHFSHKELKGLLEKYFEEVKLYGEGKYAWLDRFVPGMFSFMILFEAKNPKK